MPSPTSPSPRPRAPFPGAPVHRGRAHLAAPHVAALLVAALFVATSCSTAGPLAAPPSVAEQPVAEQPHAGAGASTTAAELVAPTQRVVTGRFVVDVQIGAGREHGGRMLHTTVEGAFDRTGPAFEAAIDLEPVHEAMPELTAGLPGHLRGDSLEVRVVGPDAWVRARHDDAWRPVLGGAADLPTLTGAVGPDELLALVAASRGEVRPIGPRRVEGHISADEVLAAAPGPHDRLGSVAGQVPRELGERLFRYEVALDASGLVEEVVVELDVESLAAAAGQPAPDGVALRYVARLAALGEPVAITAPGPDGRDGA